MELADYMKFYFVHGSGDWELLAKVPSKEEAMKLMKSFLDDHSYTSYYTRSWFHDNEEWFDVGSYTEFFVLVH